jgi:hypothetical protein
MIVLFNKSGTKATATTSATQVYCKVYGGTGSNGPGSQLGMEGDSLGKIAATTPTTQVSFIGNPNVVYPSNILVHVFNFPAPVIIPTSGFYGAVTAPNNSAADSIRIYGNTKTSATNDSSSWILISANNWRSIRYQRGVTTQLAIMPQITCRPFVGMAETSGLREHISVMPNPASGIFHLIFTLKEPEKLTIRVLNYIGQELSSEEVGNVSAHALDLDLSNKPEGVYFLEISNGKERLTKKLIITR